jgi:hypothetical protein
VVPKRSYMATYSSQVDHRLCLGLLDAWMAEVHRAGLPRGSSFDLDVHTVPAYTQEEPLEKHYVSRRRQQGILTFLARDASHRLLCYARAGIPKAEQADEIVRLVDLWQQHTGQPPAESVFDSQLTPYATLNRLNQRGIRFLTLRRRSRRMLGQIWSRPASAWRRITLPALTRALVGQARFERFDLFPDRGQTGVGQHNHKLPPVLVTQRHQHTS